MRDTFISTLTREASKDPDIMLLTGDLGFGVFDEYRKYLPEQFLNVGIAEQNMTGIATGLALVGKKVFTYSIGNFPTLRCLEQIRNDSAYHNANVTIVAVGAGFSYGQLGMSHHATEDLGIMRSIPQVTVFSPSTLLEVEQVTTASLKIKGTCYIRLDKSFADSTSFLQPDFIVGKPSLIRKGKDLTIVSTGGILEEVILALDSITDKNATADVFSCHTISPFDDKEIIASLVRTKKMMVVEEHSLVAGLSGLMSERVVDSNIDLDRIKKIGIDHVFCTTVGDQKYLREKYKMDANSIRESISRLIG